MEVKDQDACGVVDKLAGNIGERERQGGRGHEKTVEAKSISPADGLSGYCPFMLSSWRFPREIVFCPKISPIKMARGRRTSKTTPSGVQGKAAGTGRSCRMNAV
jgi:hypothetical protein